MADPFANQHAIYDAQWKDIMSAFDALDDDIQTGQKLHLPSKPHSPTPSSHAGTAHGSKPSPQCKVTQKFILMPPKLGLRICDRCLSTWRVPHRKS